MSPPRPALAFRFRLHPRSQACLPHSALRCLLQPSPGPPALSTGPLYLWVCPPFPYWNVSTEGQGLSSFFLP